MSIKVKVKVKVKVMHISIANNMKMMNDMAIINNPIK